MDINKLYIFDRYLIPVRILDVDPFLILASRYDPDSKQKYIKNLYFLSWRFSGMEGNIISI